DVRQRIPSIEVLNKEARVRLLIEGRELGGIPVGIYRTTPSRSDTKAGVTPCWSSPTSGGLVISPSATGTPRDPDAVDVRTRREGSQGSFGSNAGQLGANDLIDRREMRKGGSFPERDKVWVVERCLKVLDSFPFCHINKAEPSVGRKAPV